LTASTIVTSDGSGNMVSNTALGNLNANGTLAADSVDYTETTGSIKALTPIAGTAAGFAAGFTGVNLYGGVYRVTTAGACALPDPAVNMNFTIINEIAGASTIASLATGTADTIYLNGLAADQDEDLTSASIGAMCTFRYQAADTWQAICFGYTEVTPP